MYVTVWIFQRLSRNNETLLNHYVKPKRVQNTISNCWNELNAMCSELESATQPALIYMIEVIIVRRNMCARYIM